MTRPGRLSTRRICCSAMIAGIYACTTWILSPLSYGPFQFRLSEILKPLVLFYPDSIFAFPIGVFAANLVSPYAGPWELLFMPLANIIGGYLAIRASAYGVLAGAMTFAVTIAIAVSVTLGEVLQLNSLTLLPPILVSQVILYAIGIPLTGELGKILNEWVNSRNA